MIEDDKNGEATRSIIGIPTSWPVVAVLVMSARRGFGDFTVKHP